MSIKKSSVIISVSYTHLRQTIKKALLSHFLGQKRSASAVPPGLTGKIPPARSAGSHCLCRRGGFPVTGGSSVGNYWGLPARSLPPSRVHSAYRCRPVSSSSGSLCGSFGARTYTRSAVFSMLSIVYRQGSLVKLRLRIGSAADLRGKFTENADALFEL